MPEQSEHHQQDEVDDQQRIIEKGEKDEIDRQKQYKTGCDRYGWDIANIRKEYFSVFVKYH